MVKIVLGVTLFVFWCIGMIAWTDVGRERVRRVTVDQVNALLTGAQVEIDGIEGNLLHRASLTGIRLVRNDGKVMASVDSARAHYRLWPLIMSGRIELPDIQIRGLALQLEQYADSTWDIGSLLVPSEESGTTILHLDKISLLDASVVASFYSDSGDSTFVMNPLSIAVSDLHTDPIFRMNLDSLSSSFTPPGQKEEVRLQARGHVEPHRISDILVSLTSKKSVVLGEGDLDLERLEDVFGGFYSEADSLSALEGETRFSLSAEPLDFADVAAFIPGLDPNGSLRLTLNIEQLEDRATAKAALSIQDAGDLTLEASAGNIERRNGGRSLEVIWALDAMGLRPGVLWGDDNLTGGLSFVSEARLSGPSSDQLSGSLTVDADSFQIDEWRFAPSHLTVTKTSGEADGKITLGVNGADLQAQISGRWLDDDPSWALSGSLLGADLAQFLEGTSLRGVLGADIQLAGRGSSPDDMTFDSEILINTSPFGRDSLNAGQIGMRYDRGNIAWETSLSRADGTLIANGQASVIGAQSLDLSSLRINRLDVAALLNREEVSSVTASLTGQDQAFTWPDATGSMELALAPSTWGTVSMRRTSAKASWRRGVIALTMDAEFADSAFVSIKGTVTPPAEQQALKFTLETFTWADLDLAELLDDPSLESSISGSMTGSGRMTDLDDISATAMLDISGTMWPTHVPLDGHVVVDAGKEGIRLKTQTRFPESESDSGNEASIALDLFITSLAKDGRIDLERLELTALDPARLSGSEPTGDDLNGSGSGFILFKSVTPDSGSIDIVFGPSILGGVNLSSSRLTSALQDSVVTANITMTSDPGELSFEATTRPFDSQPGWSAIGEARSMDLAGLAGMRDTPSDINLDFALDGTGFSAEKASIDVRIGSNSSMVDALRVDSLIADVNWSNGVLHIGQLTANTNVGDLTVSGPINVSPDRSDTYSDLRLTAYLTDISPLQRLAGFDRLASRDVALDWQLFGPAGELSSDVLVSVTDIALNDVQISSVEATGSFSLTRDWLPDKTTGRVDLGFVSLPTLGIRTTMLFIRQKGEFFTFTGSAMVDAGTKLDFATTVNPLADRPFATLSQMTLYLEQTKYQLVLPAGFSLFEGVAVDNFQLASEGQSLRVVGGYKKSSGFALRADVEAFEIGPLARLAAYPNLEGGLSGNLRISGALEYPVIDSRMTLDMRAGTLPVAVIVAEVQSVAQGLYLDASVTSEGSGPIKIEGFLPVNPDFTGDQRAIEGYEEQELNLDITMESGSINWVQSFLDPEVVSGLQGMASAAISVAGTVEDPNLSGFLNVDKARFRLPELGVTYRLDRIRSTLSGVTMTLQEGHLRSGDGTMDITGTIDFASLDNSSFNLAATLDEFRTVQNNEIHTTLSGDINLSGRTTRPVLTGTLRTINTSYWVTEDVGGDLKPVSLTFEDEVMLAENFGYRPVIADTLADAMYRGLEMDLNLVLERDTWIRQRVNPEMAIELSGRLEIRKQRGQEDFEIFRSIEVNPDRSTIKQFGRKFRIAEGSVSFNGPLEEMMMNMSAEYEVQSRLNPGQPEVVITLTISGRLDDLELTLSSDPPLENTDIVSYIATGRPASESLQFSQNAMNNQRLVGIAASQLAGVVEGIAAEGLGLDVVDIQQDGLKGTRLTAGKYVSPRLFIGVSQPISFGGNTSSSLEQSRELTLEYKIFEMLLLQLLADASTSSIRINFTGRYSY